jgi:hypothetical protein
VTDPTHKPRWSPGHRQQLLLAPLEVVGADGALEGKVCPAYPAVGPEVNACGGRWIDVPMDEAHVDGNLVTAPAWPAAFLAGAGNED